MCLALVPSAAAGGGNYAFEGGSVSDRAQVASALDASAFPWGLVPGPVEIVIAHGAGSWAIPGTISLDADLLDAGVFSWGTIQHEYAHEVDFYLLNGLDRALLLRRLGGTSWLSGDPQALHAQLGSERFASTLTWAYWPTVRNTMRPQGPHDEAAGMAPAAFRALLGSLLGRPALANVRH